MNSFRFISRVFKSPISVSNFATAAGSASKGKAYRPKTFKEAWLSDVGAYPVMGVIVFAVMFCSTYGFSVMFSHPDARLAKSSRKSLFRGELKSEGYDASSLAPVRLTTRGEDEH